jgi:hypothetical protein
LIATAHQGGATCEYRGVAVVNAVSPTRRRARLLSVLAAAVLATFVAATASPAAELSTFSGVTAPSLTGTAAVGETLYASFDGASISPTPDSTKLEIIVGDVNRGLADSVGLTAADLGKQVTARLTVMKDGYETVVIDSAPSAVIVKGTQSFTPVISGTVAQGFTLSVKGLPEGATFAYKWKRSGSTISGATGATYKLTSTDIGKTITVTVTSYKLGYNALTKTSAPTAAVKRVFTYAYTPVVTGTAKVGYTLKATTKPWSPLASLKYQWYRNGVAISGATTTSRKLTSADQGAIITVKVTGSKSGYLTVTRTSKATAVVAKGTITAPTPTISGTARAGSYLKVSLGTVSPSTAVKTYQWLRNGVAIEGATGATIALKNVDAGKKLSVKVTYTATGYGTKTLTSAAVTIATRTASMSGVNVYSPDGVSGIYIAPGTYVTNSATPECFWVRDDDDDSENGWITDNEWISGYGLGVRWIIEIAPTDVIFFTMDCGSWIKYDGTGSNASSVSKDGMFGIGVDIKPGIYERTGGDGICYAYLEANALNEASSIIEEFEVAVGDEVVVGGGEEAFFSTYGCGSWTRTGDVPEVG